MHQKFLFSKTQQLITLMREISLKKKKSFLSHVISSQKGQERLLMQLCHMKKF